MSKGVNRCIRVVSNCKWDRNWYGSVEVDNDIVKKVKEDIPAFNKILEKLHKLRMGKSRAASI